MTDSDLKVTTINTDELYAGNAIFRGAARFANGYYGTPADGKNIHTVTASNLIADEDYVLISVGGNTLKRIKFSDFCAAVDNRINGTETNLPSKTYTGVYATANTDPNGYFYFGKILPKDYYSEWQIKYRIHANIDALDDGYEYSEVHYSGNKNEYHTYDIWNSVGNTSHRPMYYNLAYWGTQTGVENSYGHLVGVSITSSYYPADATYARTFIIEIVQMINCSFEFFDGMTLYANIPGTGSTNYRARQTFDGTTQGSTHTGDRNYYERLCLANVKLQAGSNGIFGNNLCMETADGKWESITKSYTTAATKQRNTNGLKPWRIWFYSSSTTINANAWSGNSQFYEAMPYMDFRYTSNSATTLTADKPIYLVGTMTDGLFYLDETWWAQELPSTDDGKTYILVGQAYSNYQVTYFLNKPVYQYSNGAWRVVSSAGSAA